MFVLILPVPCFYCFLVIIFDYFSVMTNGSRNLCVDQLPHEAPIICVLTQKMYLGVRTIITFIDNDRADVIII